MSLPGPLRPRLNQRFTDLRSRGEKALVLFVTAGDPELGELPAILQALEEGGADVVEVGIPFSDPIADGPTIQASSQRALDRGVRPQDALRALSEVRLGIPVVAMGYYNPLLRVGLDRFAAHLAQAGCSGTIVSDLSPEEAEPWLAASRSAGLENIFLVAPTSTDERLDLVCGLAAGFVYAVSKTGVTGAGQEVSSDVPALVGRVKERTAVPVCVGFGISTPDHVREVCRVADGAVVGSALVDLLAREWHGGRGRGAIVQWVRKLKEATRAIT
jgi:tryptophan synthase alpha chain